MIKRILCSTFNIKDLQTLTANGKLDADFNIKSNLKTINSDGYFKIPSANIYYGLYKIGIDNINRREIELRNYLVDKLIKIPHIDIINLEADSGIIIFNVTDIFSQDGLQIFTNNLQNFKKRKRVEVVKYLITQLFFFCINFFYDFLSDFFNSFPVHFCSFILYIVLLH